MLLSFECCRSTKCLSKNTEWLSYNFSTFQYKNNKAFAVDGIVCNYLRKLSLGNGYVMTVLAEVLRMICCMYSTWSLQERDMNFLDSWCSLPVVCLCLFYVFLSLKTIILSHKSPLLSCIGVTIQLVKNNVSYKSFIGGRGGVKLRGHKYFVLTCICVL